MGLVICHIGYARFISALTFMKRVRAPLLSHGMAYMMYQGQLARCETADGDFLNCGAYTIGFLETFFAIDFSFRLQHYLWVE